MSWHKGWGFGRWFAAVDADFEDFDILKFLLWVDRWDCHVGLRVGVLGVSVHLRCHYKTPDWGAAYSRGVPSVTVGYGVGDGIPVMREPGQWRTNDNVTYSREPIETNGWAGEPQGMEKAP